MMTHEGPIEREIDPHTQAVLRLGQLRELREKAVERLRTLDVEIERQMQVMQSTPPATKQPDRQQNIPN